MSNGAWSLVLVLVLAALTMAQLKWARPTALIALIHNIVWAGALLLVGSNLVVYKEAGVASWLILTTGLVGFNLGVWLAGRRSANKVTPNKDTAKEAQGSTTTSLVSRKVLLVLIVIYLIAFLVYLWNIQSRFGLITLIIDPASIRSAPGESYLESVPLPVRLLLYLGPLLFAIFAVNGAIDHPFALGFRIGALVLLAGSMLALLQRTNLFMAVLLAAALLITQKRQTVKSAETFDGDGGSRTKWQKSKFALIASIAGLVVLAFLSFQLVGGALGKSASSQAVSTGNVSNLLVATKLSSPFIYYSGGIPAFLQLTESSSHDWPSPKVPGERLQGDYNPQTWGAATFAPILKVIPGAKPWDSINAFIDMGVLINVFTWLEPFYRDFRVVGVALGTLFLGWGIAALHRRRFRSPRALWIQATFISIVFLCTFVPKINNTLFLAELIFILLITLRWPHKRSVDGESPIVPSIEASSK